MRPMKFRLRQPWIVEALQWDGKNREAVDRLLGSHQSVNKTEDTLALQFINADGCLYTLPFGYWLMKTKDDRYEVASPSSFSSAYEFYDDGADDALELGELLDRANATLSMIAESAHDAEGDLRAALRRLGVKE